MRSEQCQSKIEEGRYMRMSRTCLLENHRLGRSAGRVTTSGHRRKKVPHRDKGPTGFSSTALFLWITLMKV